MARRAFAALASVVLVGAASVTASASTAGAAPIAGFRPGVAQRPHVASASGSVLSGTVTDESGDPLAGVEVYSFPSGDATTAADGTYSMRLPVGKRRVYFDGSAATTSSGADTGFVDVARSFQIATKRVRAATVVLATGAAVSGRVVDQQGDPLRYAGMAVLPVDQSPPYIDAIDDEGIYDGTQGGGDVVLSHRSGRFTIRGAIADSVLVCFAAQDVYGVPTGGSAGAFGYQSVCSTRPVALVPGHTVSIGRLVLPTADDGLIVGKLTRPDGRPLPYSDISLSPDRSPYLNADAYAQPDGTFASSSLPVGGYQLCADAYSPNDRPTGGFYAPCTRYYKVTAGNITHVAIRMRRGAAARGGVTTPSGRPLSNVYASFEQLGGSSPDSAAARSNSHGHFAVWGLAPGRYAVCFRPAGTGVNNPTGVLSDCAHPIHVTLTAGHLTAGVRGTLSPAAAVAGRVTDPAGRSFAHPASIHVSVGEHESTIDHDGNFLVPDLTDGRRQVCASSFGLAIVGRSCTRVTVRAGKISGGLHLVLEHADRVVVHVTDAAGHPLAGVNAALLAPCTSSAADRNECSTQPLFSASQKVVIAANAFTDSAGRATVYAPKAGNYAVCTYGYWAASATDDVSTGYTDACHDTTFGTAVGSTRRTVGQVLSAAGAVTGQVTDGDGAPIAGARIEITNSAATTYATPPAPFDYFNYGDPTVPTPKALARTDANGDYTIYSVAAGDQQVCATTPKADGSTHSCLGAPVTVTAGSIATAPSLSIPS